MCSYFLKIFRETRYQRYTKVIWNVEVLSNSYGIWQSTIVKGWIISIFPFLILGVIVINDLDKSATAGIIFLSDETLHFGSDNIAMVLISRDV